MNTPLITIGSLYYLHLFPNEIPNITIETTIIPIDTPWSQWLWRVIAIASRPIPMGSRLHARVREDEVVILLSFHDEGVVKGWAA